MNRRNFLSLAALALAGKAAERVFPFRVYSIPKEIVVTSSSFDTMFAIEQYTDRIMREAMREFDKKLMEARFQYPIAILPPVDWYSKVETMGKVITKELLKDAPICNFSP